MTRKSFRSLARDKQGIKHTLSEGFRCRKLSQRTQTKTLKKSHVKVTKGASRDTDALCLPAVVII